MWTFKQRCETFHGSIDSVGTFTSDNPLKNWQAAKVGFAFILRFFEILIISTESNAMQTRRKEININVLMFIT